MAKWRPWELGLSVPPESIPEQGISVLLVEQKIDFASPVTDYYYFMDRGVMVSQASSDEMSIEELQNHI